MTVRASCGASRESRVVTAALVLTMASATLLPPVVGVVAPFLVVSMGLSRFQFGLLPAAFFTVAALLSPRVGGVADRVGPRRAILVLLLASAVSIVGLVSVRNFPMMLAAAMVGGIGTALSNPATNRAIADSVVRSRQAVVTGWKQAGVPLAAMLAAAVVPSLANALGWRRGASVMLVLPVVTAGLVAISLKPTTSGTGREHGRGDGGESLRWLVAYFGIMGSVAAVATAYFVLFVNEALGYSTVAGGNALGASAGVGTVARIWWARAGARRASQQELLTAVAGLSAVALGLLVIAEAVTALLLWPAALLIGASVLAWTGVAHYALLSSSEIAGIGRTSGLAMRAFFTGMLLGPLFFGAIADVFNYPVAWLLQVSLAAAGAAIAWRSRPVTHRPSVRRRT